MILVYIYMFGDRSQGRLKDSLFIGYYTEVLRG